MTGVESVGEGNDEAAPRQVSVAELLARNGQSTDGARRRHRRASIDDDAPPAEPATAEPATAEPATAEPVAGEPAAVAPERVELEPVATAEADSQAVPHTVGSAVLLAELLAAAAVGAALWLGFRWLWSQWPVVALVLALVVTVAMVLGIRLVRRVEDLTSMLLAVVVGLIVTMSPAALTLVSGS